MKRPYKECISDAHVAAYRKTRHLLNGKSGVLRIPNTKRRPCVHARLMKLAKYVRRAWNGYSFGKVKTKC